jgi:hypothetical protein
MHQSEQVIVAVGENVSLCWVDSKVYQLFILLSEGLQHLPFPQTVDHDTVVAGAVDFIVSGYDSSSCVDGLGYIAG